MADKRRPVDPKFRPQHIVIWLFVMMFGMGFAGVLWTVTGAPGQRYYWTLRFPIAVLILVGMAGAFVCSIPFLNRLAARRRPHENQAEESEEELRIQAEQLCARLPLSETATWKSKTLNLCLLILGIAGILWGYRVSRLGIVAPALLVAAVSLWQTTRSLWFRTEFSTDQIRYRTFRGWRTRPYTGVLDVTPGYGVGEVRIWFRDGTKLTVYAERLTPIEILLLITERQLARS